MPDTDMDVAFSEAEYTAAIELFDSEQNDMGRERGGESANDNDPKGNEHAPHVDAATQALLEQHGGKSEDWQLVDGGRGEYSFDGENIIDREGNIWTNPDTELHEALLAQWREGGEDVFFLPDYKETKEEGDFTIETLYVTQLHLDEESGEVSWSIHSHETVSQREEEASAPIVERDHGAERPAARWYETLEDAPAIENTEDAEAALSVAAELSQELQLEREDPIEDAADKKLGALLEKLFDATGKETSEALLSKEESLSIDLSRRETENISPVVGIRPSPFDGSARSASPTTFGEHPAAKDMPVHIADLNGIRMERWAA